VRTRPSAFLRHTVDRLIDSPTHYWVVMVSDVIWALAFLAVGWAHYTGRVPVAIAAVVAGFLGWGLLEYVIHRWVLHGAPSFARRNHARHHGDVHALISTPFLVIAMGALAMRVVLGLVLPSGLASLTVFGLYAGYNYFALLHHLQHHRGATLARVESWRMLATLHDVHHHRPHVHYGITTTLWDRVFGTCDPTTRRP
jgi:sterol desaturase/sphingolipid hydroxylase (fatty acid hydroxylase superfamily)